MADNKVVIREFDEDRDVKVVGKLERNCEIGTTKKGFSIFTNMITDPLSRIRFYPIRVMLVCNNHSIVHFSVIFNNSLSNPHSHYQMHSTSNYI